MVLDQVVKISAGSVRVARKTAILHRGAGDPHARNRLEFVLPANGIECSPAGR
jgi:hypothetical protein